ncbi:MAG: recombinase family protein [Alphaproteobacteria bacterium]
MTKNSDVVVHSHPVITPDHLRRLAIIYIRQSSEEQVRENTGSTDYQRSLAGVARSHGWLDALIQIIDEDLGKSGSSSEGRSGWKRLQMMVAAKQVGAVFVASISRLSRQLNDFEVFRMLAAASNTLLYTEGRFVDPADSNDIIFSQITAMMAAFENRQRVRIMSQARMTKARQGAVVSSLPVGWIKGPDGKYDYDPEVKDLIRAIIDTFWQHRSIRRTVKALVNAGGKIPSRLGPRIDLARPTLNNVRRILVNPAYAGTYVFGKTESQRGAAVLATGQSPRVKVPEHLWVKTFNNHPAYMTPEEQEEIKRILRNNHFIRRDRPGRGPALTQGLLRCALCRKSLSVNYCRGKSYVYGCGWEREPCTRFISYEFDQYILKKVFALLQTPPLEMLKAGIEESRKLKLERRNWINSERERLDHEEQKARERADLTRGDLPRVYRDALEKLERVFQEKEEFERKIAREQSAPKADEPGDDLEELCRLASDVPGLWHHPVVTHQERKEILRCLIDHIVVTATKERIDATIVWKAREKTSFHIWRGIGCYNLIRELHAQGLTVFEIQACLATGKTSNGQVVKITVGRLYMILRKLGLKPNRFSAAYLKLRQRAAELNRAGQPLEWIAEHFNEQRFQSASGTPWTRDMIYGLIRARGRKIHRLEDLHCNAITEARSRGLNYRQMAVEFNDRKLRRRDGQPWRAIDIRRRWTGLNRLKRDREQKGETPRSRYRSRLGKKELP